MSVIARRCSLGAAAQTYDPAVPAPLAHTIKGSPSGGTTNFTTSAIDTSGASLLTAAISSYNNTGSGLTDSKSNTWTALVVKEDGAFSTIQMFYCLTPTVGTGHTFTTGGQDFATIAVQAWSGHTTAVDVNLGAFTTGGATIQPGSGTPAHDGELLLSALSSQKVETFTIDSAFTIIDQLPQTGGLNVAGGVAYRNQQFAAAINPTWTGSGGNATRAAVMASFP